MAIDEKAKSPSEDLIFERLCRLRLVPWGRGEQTSNERRRPAVRDLTREDAVFYEENELQDAALSAGSHLVLLNAVSAHWAIPISCFAELQPRGDRDHLTPSGCAPLSRLSASRRRASHRNSICGRELDLHSGSDGLDGKSAKASSLRPLTKNWDSHPTGLLARRRSTVSNICSPC